MDGALRIRIAAQDGESRVIESYAHAPFHYLPPMHRDGAPPLLTVVNSSGGVVGGDVLDMQVDLGRGSTVMLRQQAATKVYRSETGPARSCCRFRLADAAVLDYFPEEIIPFAGSDYAQTTEITLAPGATALFGEIVTAGRLARGERFAFTRLDLDLQCTGNGTLLLRDRAELRPAQQPLDNPALLGDATIWASFYALTTQPLPAVLIEAVDDVLHSVAAGAGGATAAPAGLVGRVVGTSLDTVRAAMQRARALVLNGMQLAEGDA
ncbi:MAG: urease accessory protein UreD [Candidatus Binatia bacterium]